MSSNNEEQQIASNAYANEAQTQVSISEEVRSVLSENVQLRENLKGTISSLEERNCLLEAEIYDLKQKNNALWANVKREKAEIEQIDKDIQQYQAQYKLELAKRDELTNKNMSIRLVTGEIRNHVKKIVADKNTGEVEAKKNYEKKETIKLELEAFSQQFDSLTNHILQERKKYVDELKPQEDESNERPLKLANDINSKKNELIKLKSEFEEVMTKINEKTKIITEAQKSSQLKKERIAEVKNEIIALEKYNNEAALNLDRRIAGLLKGISALEEEIDGKKNSMEQLNLGKVNVLNQVKILENANKNIAERIIPLKEKISSLSESETSLQNEIESLKRSIEPLIGIEARHEELTQRVLMMAENVQGLTSSMSSEKNKLEGLQEKHIELQSVLDSMKDRSRELDEEKEQVKQKYNDLVALISETGEEHAAKMKELRETLDGISANIKECQRKIFEAKIVDEELSKKISELETVIEGCCVQKSDLEEKLELLNEKSKTLEKTLLDEESSHQTDIDSKAEEIKELTLKIGTIRNSSAELQELEMECEDLVLKKSTEMALFNEKKTKAELEMKNYLKEINKMTLSLERDYELAENELLEKKTNFLTQDAETKKRIEILTNERETMNAKLIRYNEFKKKLERQCANYERMMTQIKNELNVTKRDIYNVMYKDKK